ncbi:hypothetical protein [Mycolicibacterium fortuitum]|uniref:hypothetical protein n=1 Tax=Mycolicibacterium fortuitum TaxID=1766 RepID=UPI00260C92F6|nr:hypothetical protein [Mycolicibacterium fortuitum]
MTLPDSGGRARSIWLVSIGVIGLATSVAQQSLVRLRYRQSDDELRLLTAGPEDSTGCNTKGEGGAGPAPEGSCT